MAALQHQDHLCENEWSTTLNDLMGVCRDVAVGMGADAMGERALNRYQNLTWEQLQILAHSPVLWTYVGLCLAGYTVATLVPYMAVIADGGDRRKMEYHDPRRRVREVASGLRQKYKRFARSQRAHQRRFAVICVVGLSAAVFAVGKLWFNAAAVWELLCSYVPAEASAEASLEILQMRSRGAYLLIAVFAPLHLWYLLESLEEDPDSVGGDKMTVLQSFVPGLQTFAVVACFFASAFVHHRDDIFSPVFNPVHLNWDAWIVVQIVKVLFSVPIQQALSAITKRLTRKQKFRSTPKGRDMEKQGPRLIWVDFLYIGTNSLAETVFWMHFLKAWQVDPNFASSQGTVMNIVPATFLLFLLNELFWGLTHRMLHTRLWYRHVHQHNHRKWPRNIALDCINSHPVDYALKQACAWAAIVVTVNTCGVHFFALLVFVPLLAIAHALQHTYRHVRLTAPEVPLLPTLTFDNALHEAHLLHGTAHPWDDYRHSPCNFSTGVQWMSLDKIWGTYHPPYDTDTEDEGELEGLRAGGSDDAPAKNGFLRRHDQGIGLILRVDGEPSGNAPVVINKAFVDVQRRSIFMGCREVFYGGRNEEAFLKRFYELCRSERVDVVKVKQGDKVLPFADKHTQVRGAIEFVKMHGDGDDDVGVVLKLGNGEQLGPTRHVTVDEENGTISFGCAAPEGGSLFLSSFVDSCREERIEVVSQGGGTARRRRGAGVEPALQSQSALRRPEQQHLSRK